MNSRGPSTTQEALELLQGVERMGCTMFTGLTGNFALPRQTGAATATWNTETNDPARSGHGSPVPGSPFAAESDLIQW